jgi:sortase A
VYGIFTVQPLWLAVTGIFIAERIVTVRARGHRTTYLQPFRDIDDLRPGDQISLETPYGTFGYVFCGQAIVDDQDRAILRRRPFEKLVLSACHPLYSASRRIVVFARLRR